jgi:ABC-type uncharacterized transport system ATPase subunit
MPQAEEICQHVIMIHRGRKVLDEALATISSHYDRRTIEFDPLDSGVDMSSIARLPGVERVDPDDSGYKILLIDGINPADAMRRIIEVATPARLELSRPRLEEIFIRLVTTSVDTVEDRKKLRADLKDSDAGEATL